LFDLSENGFHKVITVDEEDGFAMITTVKTEKPYLKRFQINRSVSNLKLSTSVFVFIIGDETRRSQRERKAFYVFFKLKFSPENFSFLSAFHIIPFSCSGNDNDDDNNIKLS
jgi:hypothetical protein